jgi:hypothetical protein
MDIYRIKAEPGPGLAEPKREAVAQGVPCRVYRKSARGLRAGPGAYETSADDMLACACSVPVRAGDEIAVRRAGAGPGGEERYFAGEPAKYLEPFGGALPGLAHQQIALSAKRRASARPG